MIETIVEIFKDMPKELVTIIIASLPVSELRGAIPLALITFEEPVLKVFFLAILGNIIPVAPLLLFFRPISERLRRFRLWNKFFDWLFERTKRKAALIEKYEVIGLALFVAIPLPITGAWTGCIAASLFKIKFRHAFLAICTGICIAATIVTSVTLIGKGVFFRFFAVH